MAKLTTLESNTELAKLIAECVINNIRFKNGPTSYSVQDAFSGVVHLPSLKQMANDINNQLKKLDTDDLFVDGSASQKYNKTVLTLKKDALVATVKFIEAARKAELEAEKVQAEKATRLKNLKIHLDSKEFEEMAALDAKSLREEYEALKAELG